ncbi:hypothetical protein DERF_013468 [Dermatophagoides farinae]|uniref:Uncharacterized protein n=1 Tax=Dermatophagoides farinae TaxID=6954 RepID=A0A922KVA2_DERFA|nr:hypothetical protein HUG17_1143 [Dermatophagoides farinae]KAH9497476.1 hypothetical protein DERF_013468 [Dermatophagoides farinae]
MFVISLYQIWIIFFASSIFLFIFKCVTNEKQKQYKTEYDNEQKAKKSATVVDPKKEQQPQTKNKSPDNLNLTTLESMDSAFRPRSTQEEFLSKNLMSVIPAPGDETIVTKTYK